MIYGIMFVLALFVGMGAVDNMLDNPIALMIAIFSLAVMVIAERKLKTC